MLILVPSAQPKHSAPPPPFIRRPPLFGSRLLPRDVGVSGAGSEAEPPPSHWRLRPRSRLALRQCPVRACGPPLTAVSGARRQAPRWPPLPLRESRRGTTGLPIPAGGAASGVATPGGRCTPLQKAQAVTPAPPPSFLGPQVSLLPVLLSSSPHSLGRSPATWTLEGIPRSSPEGAAKPGLLAPTLLPSFSIHLSGTRAQSHANPWDRASLQL